MISRTCSSWDCLRKKKLISNPECIEILIQSISKIQTFLIMKGCSVYNIFGLDIRLLTICSNRKRTLQGNESHKKWNKANYRLEYYPYYVFSFRLIPTAFMSNWKFIHALLLSMKKKWTKNDRHNKDFKKDVLHLKQYMIRELHLQPSRRAEPVLTSARLDFYVL